MSAYVGQLLWRDPSPSPNKKGTWYNLKTKVKVGGVEYEMSIGIKIDESMQWKFHKIDELIASHQQFNFKWENSSFEGGLPKCIIQWNDFPNAPSQGAPSAPASAPLPPQPPAAPQAPSVPGMPQAPPTPGVPAAVPPPAGVPAVTAPPQGLANPSGDQLRLAQFQFDKAYKKKKEWLITYCALLKTEYTALMALVPMRADGTIDFNTVAEVRQQAMAAAYHATCQIWQSAPPAHPTQVPTNAAPSMPATRPPVAPVAAGGMPTPNWNDEDDVPF